MLNKQDKKGINDLVSFLLKERYIHCNENNDWINIKLLQTHYDVLSCLVRMKFIKCFSYKPYMFVDADDKRHDINVTLLQKQV